MDDDDDDDDDDDGVDDESEGRGRLPRDVAGGGGSCVADGRSG